MPPCCLSRYPLLCATLSTRRRPGSSSPALPPSAYSPTGSGVPPNSSQSAPAAPSAACSTSASGTPPSWCSLSFILSRAQIRVVQAQITGSIIGTTLLFLGISALVGGVGRDRQTFNPASAGLLSTLLFLVVIAILLPAIFDLTERTAARGADISLIDERLSLGVSVVLLLLYAANLVYPLLTLRHVFAGDAPSGEAEWSLARALTVMVAGTAVIAIEAELASAALEATSAELGLSPVF